MTTQAIKRSVLAFGLLTLAGVAQAAPEISFKPATSWTVTAAPLSAGTSPLCAIHTEYDNGFGVGFSGADKTLRALNVDFKQQIFEPGKNYDVAFAVPGNPPQTLSGHAINASTLSAGVNGTKGLYKVLQGTTAFDLGVEGNNFRFYLTGFPAASASFEQCMAGTKPKTANDIVSIEPPNASPAMINESIALEQQETQQKPPMTEVLPDETKPQINKMAETKTEKLGDIELTPSEIQELARPADAGGHKRMSEQLAEKIAREPEIAAIESTPQDFKNKIKDANNKEANEKVKDTSVIAPVSSVDVEPIAPPPVKTEIKAQGKSKDMAPVEMKSAAIAPPPVVPTKDEEKAMETAAKDAAIPVMDKPAMKVGSLSPDDKIIFNAPRAGSNVAPPQKSPTAKVTNKKSPDMVVHREKQDAGVIDMTGRSEEPVISADEPFARPLEHIETGPAKNKAASWDASSTDAPVRNGTPAAPRKADPDMLRKISELEQQVRDLKYKGAAADPHAEEGANISISTDNWNLERATMRFNESEREVKRLGQQLQQERAQWAVEKQEMESQLFDPQVTSQQQLARLNQLEKQLTDAQQKLEDQRIQYEERLRMVEGHKTASQ